MGTLRHGAARDGGLLHGSAQLNRPSVLTEDRKVGGPQGEEGWCLVRGDPEEMPSTGRWEMQFHAGPEGRFESTI